MKRIIFAILLCVFAGAAGAERIRDAALSSDYAYRQVAHLCNNIGPRLSGSPQAAEAVTYVAEEMRKLGLEVRLAQQGVLEDVAHRLDGDREIPVEDARVVAGHLAIGESVEVPADRIEGLRDVERGPRGRALEQQMLDEMAGAVQLGRFIARTDADPDADAHAGHVRLRRGGHSQPVVQSSDGIHAIVRITDNSRVASRNQNASATDPHRLTQMKRRADASTPQ